MSPPAQEPPGPRPPRPPRLPHPATRPLRAWPEHPVELRDRALGAEDLEGRSLRGAHVEACVLTRCPLDGTDLREATLDGCLLARCSGARVAADGAVLRDVALEQPRVGVLGLEGAHLARASVTGGKLDLCDLRGARVLDLRLRDVVVGELDLSLARLERVALEGCRVGTLRLHDATLVDVDLRGAALGAVHGVRHLAGAVLGTTQLLDLAPALAAELGVRVLPPDHGPAA